MIDCEIKDILEKQNKAIALFASMVFAAQKSIVMLISNEAGCIETQLNKHFENNQGNQKLSQLIDASSRVFFDQNNQVIDCWKKIIDVLGFQAPPLSKIKELDDFLKKQKTKEEKQKDDPAKILLNAIFGGSTNEKE